jgi:hypothetical protein
MSSLQSHCCKTSSDDLDSVGGGQAVDWSVVGTSASAFKQGHVLWAPPHPAPILHRLSLPVSQGLKQSRFRKLYSVGRAAYRWGSLSYSALQLYTNPWMVQAILTAIWTISRVGIRIIGPGSH